MRDHIRTQARAWRFHSAKNSRIFGQKSNNGHSGPPQEVVHFGWSDRKADLFPFAPAEEVEGGT